MIAVVSSGHCFEKNNSNNIEVRDKARLPEEASDINHFLFTPLYPIYYDSVQIKRTIGFLLI